MGIYICPLLQFLAYIYIVLFISTQFVSLDLLENTVNYFKNKKIKEPYWNFLTLSHFIIGITHWGGHFTGENIEGFEDVL